MKKLTILLTLLVSFLYSQATNYYVSTAGNDGNNGTSTGTPWRTLAKVNNSWGIIQPGDTIFLRGGDTFRETLTIGKSGTNSNRIVVTSYGTGKALISGYNVLTGFSLTSGSIYQVSFPQGKAQLINVEINGSQAQIGRTPNANQTPYFYEAFSTNTSITDNQLTASPTWTGAEVVMRKSHWAYDRAKVISHSGTVVNYGFTGFTLGGNQSLWTPDKVGYGYWFQNSLQTLDTEGEWYFNPNTQIFYFHTGGKLPTAFTVKAASRDTGININNKAYITIDGINIEGTNIAGIYALNTDNIIIKNDTVTKSVVSILFRNVGNTTIEDNVIDHALTSGIVVESPNKSNVTIQRNVVNNVYMIAGMGDYSNDPIGLRNIRANANNLLVKRNFITNSGYSGINFQGNNVVIEENRVDSFCRVQEDNGAIYVYSGPQSTAPASPVYTNRVVRKNIITNAIGNLYAMPTNSLVDLAGIYLDGKSMAVDILDNYLYNIPGPAINSNNGNNVRATGNLFHKTAIGVRGNLYTWGTINNFVVTSNVLVPIDVTETIFQHSFQTLISTTPGSQVGSLFTLDSNRVYSVAHTPFSVSQSANMSLSAWQATTGEDSRTQMIPIPQEYTISSTTGSNRATNPSFTTNITGYTAFNCTGVWDNTNQISGGSYRVSFSSPTIGRYGTIHSSIGSVTNGQIYRVRFKTKGTTQNGLVRVYFRKTASPFTDVTSRKFSTYGLDVKQHEVYLETTTDVASLVLDFEQTSGTTFIDNIEVQQMIASKNNLTDSVIVEYNDTNADGYVILPGKYRDAFGNTYNGEDTLSAWESKAYFYMAPLDATNTPPTADAGSFQSIKLPTNSVNLVGTGNDSDGTITQYSWVKTSGPSVTIEKPNSLSTAVTFTTSGTYNFRFTVTDNGGLTASDTVSVVVAPANIVPSVNAGSSQTIQLPTTLSLSGSASDADGTISSTVWTKISGGSATIVSPNSLSTQVTDLTNGTYVFRLTATDNEGGTNFANVTITVLPPNQFPNVDAGLDKGIVLPLTSVNLVGTASDPDGTISSVFWSKVTSGSHTISPVNGLATTVSNLSQGVHILALTATDNQGFSSSDTVIITVLPSTGLGNQPPIVTVNSPVVIRVPQDTVTISGSAVDTDGSIVSYQWAKVSGPTNFNILNSTSSSTLLSSLKAGTYVFSLTATDNQGAKTAGYVTVYVLRKKTTSTLTTDIVN